MAESQLPDDETERVARIRKFSHDHLQRYLATGGDDGYSDGRSTSLLLTTVGRKSGRPRSSPLIFGRDRDSYVLVGSYGGSARHPDWYLNLLANPEVCVQVKADRFRGRARTVTGAERRRLWTMMAEILPAYDDYQRRTEREIPVVVIDRL